MNSKQLVSVVLCTYNGSLFIEEQIRTILNQTYPIAELIIVDDHSTDNTLAVIERLAAENSCIRLYQNPVNLGFTANFEKALLLAQHELVAIADQDDVWHRQKIEILIQHLTDDCSLVYCDSVRFSDKPPESPRPNRKNRRIEGTNPRRIAVFNTISGHAVIIRKQLLAHALPIAPAVYYDWWLAMVAMCNGGVKFVPQVLVYQRAHTANVTIQPGLSNAELRRSFRTMLNEHLNHFRTIGEMNEQDRQFFEALYFLWHRSLSQKINWRLFFFLIRYRHDIFFYKVRKFAFISQFKHCFLFSFRL